MNTMPADVMKAYRSLKLTSIQRRVFSEFLKERSDADTANLLDLTSAQVELHRKRVMGKLRKVPDKEVRLAIIKDFDNLFYRKPTHGRLPGPDEMIAALLSVMRSAKRLEDYPLTERQEMVLLYHFAGVRDIKIARRLKLYHSAVRKQRVSGLSKLMRVVTGDGRRTRVKLCFGLLLAMTEDRRQYRLWARGPWADTLFLRADFRQKRLSVTPEISEMPEKSF